MVDRGEQALAAVSDPCDRVQTVSNIVSISTARPQALEFFAGIGLARLGLEEAGFHVAWANDYEKDKRDLYAGHFKDEESASSHSFTLGDIGDVTGSDLPRNSSLAWGSSPCTDLSLAGSRGGLKSGESNAFWHYMRVLDELGPDKPPIAVLENVVGLASSHGGDDLTEAIRAFNDLGYSVDILAIDARRFVPQSRPRLFLVAAQNVPTLVADSKHELRPEWLQSFYEDPNLIMHRAALPTPPEMLLSGFSEQVEHMEPNDTRWWDSARTALFRNSLSAVQAQRIETLVAGKDVVYRTAYRRTRKGVAVWEVRPDDISGCLRTARGGSSKQAVVQLGRGGLRVRWMTPVEYARLMGAGDYNLEGARTNQALFAFGDAVAVPAVRWLAENYLMPLLRGNFHHEEAVQVAEHG
jgi:DNA (cytosine-5)-methyltransferase 1